MARARGSASVGLVGGKGFSCHLRLRGKGNGTGEGKSQKAYLRHVVWLGRRVPGSTGRRELFYGRRKSPNVIPPCGSWGMLAPAGLQVGHGGLNRILGSPGLPKVTHLTQRVKLKSQRGAWALHSPTGQNTGRARSTQNSWFLLQNPEMMLALYLSQACGGH